MVDKTVAKKARPLRLSQFTGIGAQSCVAAVRSPAEVRPTRLTDRARRLRGACQLTELAPAARRSPRSAVREPKPGFVPQPHTTEIRKESVMLLGPPATFTRRADPAAPTSFAIRSPWFPVVAYIVGVIPHVGEIRHVRFLDYSQSSSYPRAVPACITSLPVYPATQREMEGERS